MLKVEPKCFPDQTGQPTTNCLRSGSDFCISRTAIGEPLVEAFKRNTYLKSRTLGHIRAALGLVRNQRPPKSTGKCFRNRLHLRSRNRVYFGVNRRTRNCGRKQLNRLPALDKLNLILVDCQSRLQRRLVRNQSADNRSLRKISPDISSLCGITMPLIQNASATAASSATSPVRSTSDARFIVFKRVCAQLLFPSSLVNCSCKSSLLNSAIFCPRSMRSPRLT